MKYIGLILALGAWCALGAVAEELDRGSISGFVRGADDGEALIGASVFFADLQQGTISNISGYYVMDWLLSVIYAYRMPLNLWPLVVSILAIFSIVTLTVGGKVMAAARVNPVEHLRNE